MSNNYIYSTLTADNAYAIYENNPNADIPVIERKILIKGGANVADRKTLYTPKGVVTQVSDEDLALLEKDYSFQQHVKNGFIKVERHEAPVEKIVADMTPKDKSAPKTPNDFLKDHEVSADGEAPVMSKKGRR